MIANRNRHYHTGQWIFLMILGVGLGAYILPTALLALAIQFDVLWAALLVLGVLYPLYGIFYPEVSAFFSVKRYRKDSDGEGLYKITFGDVIEVSNGNIRTIMEYRDLTAVVHLQYTYELKKNKRIALFVDPNGFTKGTFEEFKQFLRAKCPDLTIPE